MAVLTSTLLERYATILFFANFVRAVPNTVLCGQYENITDQTNTYSFGTNVWGLDGSGSSCLHVTDNATAMSSTWSWRANDTSVHAYPNINYNPVQQDPIQISDLFSLDVKVSWSMKPTSDASSSVVDVNGLAKVNAMTNVAFDMFFDPKVKDAINTTAPSYEMMVWIGKFGSILPIGASNSVNVHKLPQQKIGKETFTLYQGSNDNGQLVFSWVAGSNRTDFEGDISPLIHYLWRHGLMLATNYIGVIQFGTEQKHATSNVTFAVDNFAINITRGARNQAAGVVRSVSRWNMICALVFAAIVGLA